MEITAPIPVSRPGRPAGPARTAFSAGDVIGRSFSVWLRNFVPFSAVTLVVNLPVFVVTGLAPVEGGPAGGLLENLVSGLANLVVTGALTFGVLQALHGRPVTVGALDSFGHMGGTGCGGCRSA